MYYLKITLHDQFFSFEYNQNLIILQLLSEAPFSVLTLYLFSPTRNQYQVCQNDHKWLSERIQAYEAQVLL